MSASVLVAYATKFGSTQEVAEAVAATMREQGLAVDLQPVHSVRSVEGYDAVVLGAPLIMFRWHKDARRFLSRYREALAARPVAVFAMGPVKNPRDEDEWQGSREQLDKALVQFPWLKPIAVDVLGGKFDPTALRFPYTLPGNPLKKMPVSDSRDWAEIGAWAGRLVAKLDVSAAAPKG